jgi:hypothetical protein
MDDAFNLGGEKVGGLLNRIATNGTMTVQMLGKIVEALSSVNLASQLQGTDTNDNAAAGIVGEYISSEILVGAAVGLTTATSANVTSISLTPGDWDVWGNVWFSPAATTNITIHQGALSTTSATLPTAPGAGAFFKSILVAGQVPNAIFGATVGSTRVSIASTTSVYLVAQATFSVSTLSAYGFIAGRRRR